MDETKLNEMLGRFVIDLGATVSAGNVVLGDRLGLYRALADGPVTPAELAAHGPGRRDTSGSGCGPGGGRVRHVRRGRRQCSLTPAQAAGVPEGGLAPGAFLLAVACLADPRSPRRSDRRGIGGTSTIPACSSAASGSSGPATSRIWCRRGSRRWTACRPAQGGHRGGRRRLRARRFARSCADAFPASSIGLRLARAVDRARPRGAADAGVADRITFAVARADDFAGDGYDLAATFDCLHDMGDPVGAARHIRGARPTTGSG